MDGRIFSSATASEYLSPIPSIEMFLGAAVKDVNNPREITLNEFSRMRRTNNGIRWEGGRSWETTEGAVAKAYAAEFARRLDFFASLSGRIRVQSRHRPHLSRPGVTFEAPFVGDDEHADAQVSRRLLRLLEGAVLETGKKPNPGGPLVIDRAYWAGVVDAYFGRVVGEPSDEGLILEPAFLPVLAEWARIFGLAEGETIRMIRAELSLPSAPEAFVAEMSAYARELFATVDALTELTATAGWQFYRRAAAAVNRLRARSLQHAGEVTIDVMFMEHPGTRRFFVPAVGIRIPPPVGGYELELQGGEIVRLPHPPWLMPHTILTARDS